MVSAPDSVTSRVGVAAGPGDSDSVTLRVARPGARRDSGRRGGQARVGTMARAGPAP